MTKRCPSCMGPVEIVCAWEGTSFYYALPGGPKKDCQTCGRTRRLHAHP